MNDLLTAIFYKIREEYLQLLKEFDVVYDEKYLFDWIE